MNAEQYLRILIGEQLIQLAQALAQRDEAVEKLPEDQRPKPPTPPEAPKS